MHRQLLRLATAKDIRAKLKTLRPHTAESEWEEGGCLKMSIDHELTGHIPGFVHELMHYYLNEVWHIEFLAYEVEETIVEAMEKEYMIWLQRDRRRMDSWRRIVRPHIGK